MKDNKGMTVILYSPETSQGKSSFAREFLAAAARDGQDYQGWVHSPKLNVLGVDRDLTREGKEHTLSQWRDNLDFGFSMPVTVQDDTGGHVNDYDVTIIDYGGSPDKDTISEMMHIEEGLILCFITYDEKGYRLGINKLRQLSRFQKALGILTHVRISEALGQSRDVEKLRKALLFYRDDVLKNQFGHHKILNRLYQTGLLAGMGKTVSHEEAALMRNVNELWQEVKTRYGNPYQ